MTARRRIVWALLFAYFVGIPAVVVIMCSGTRYGQTPLEPNPAGEPLPRPDIVRVSPYVSDGDIRQLELQLSSAISNYVKLDPGDRSFRIQFVSEVWQDGKVVRTTREGGTTLTGPGVVCISLVGANIQNRPWYRKTMVLTDRTGPTSWYHDIETPVFKGNDRAVSARAMRKVAELSHDAPVTVWRLMAGAGSNTERLRESFEDMAKRVEWALLLKISLDGQQ